MTKPPKHTCLWQPALLDTDGGGYRDGYQKHSTGVELGAVPQQAQRNLAHNRATALRYHPWQIRTPWVLAYTTRLLNNWRHTCQSSLTSLQTELPEHRLNLPPGVNYLLQHALPATSIPKPHFRFPSYPRTDKLRQRPSKLMTL